MSNTPGEGIRAPIPPSRDDSDPLAPHNLATARMSVESTLAAWDRIFRLARHPEQEPSYATLRSQLAGHRLALDAALAAADILVADADAACLMARKLDMSLPGNVEEYALACEAYSVAASARRSIAVTRRDVINALARR